MYVVAGRGLLADITRQSPDSLTTRHHLFDLEEVAGMVGMKGPYGSEYSDRIFAHLLAKKRPPNQYAPANQTRHFTMYRTRLGLIAASILLVVLGLFVSGTNLVDGVISRMEIASAKQQTRFYDERYEIARARMPKIPAEPHDIKNAVEMARTLRTYKTTPRAMAVTLSQGLAQFPQIKVDRMRWAASTDPDKAIGARGRAANVRTAANVEGDGKTLYQLAHIEARVDPFDGDYRKALSLVRQFASTLLGLPDVEAVHVVKQPIEVDREIRGDTETTALTAPFEMRIVLRDKKNESG